MNKFFFIIFLGMAVLASGALFLLMTEGTVAFSTEVVELHEQQSIDAEDVEGLEIKVESTDVELTSYNGETIKVDFEGEVSKKMEDAYHLDVVENKGDKNVEITLERTMKPSFTVFAINKYTKLTITVPEKMYQQLTVSAASGDLSVSDIEANQLTVTAHSGDTELDNIDAEAVRVETRSGDIDANHIVGHKEIAMKTSSGDVDLGFDMKDTYLQAMTNSGDLVVDVEDMMFEEKTEEHIIGVLGVKSSTVNLQTSSGDIYVRSY